MHISYTHTNAMIFVKFSVAAFMYVKFTISILSSSPLHIYSPLYEDMNANLMRQQHVEGIT